jgi:glycosyltransferase involved in cell wall biosynthesis
MKTIILRAPLLSCSGYGTHSRQIYRWLKTKDINVVTQVVPWGITSWMINPELENGLIGDIMKDSRELKHPADISIQVQLPNEWSAGLAKKNIGISAFVETDQCNPKWINNINLMDMVVVPSEHVRQCILNTNSPKTDIHVVPESFYDSIATCDDTTSINLGIDTSFNFLVFGQLTGNNPHNDRKNTFNTIKWICEEFKDNPDVGLIIKTNSGKNTKIDRSVTEKLIKSLIKEVRPGPYPKIHLLHGSLSSEEVAALYKNKKISALVSLTRGEGFGLPLLEAAASDLPVIATNWSGHLDFLNKGKFIKVGYSLQPIHKSRVDGRVFLPNMKWAEPVEQDAKHRLRKFYESSVLPRRWAKELGVKIREQYSHTAICQQYDEVFSGII